MCKIDLYEKSESFKSIALIEKKLLKKNRKGGPNRPPPPPELIRVNPYKGWAVFWPPNLGRVGGGGGIH